LAASGTGRPGDRLVETFLLSAPLAGFFKDGDSDRHKPSMPDPRESPTEPASPN
jgi:hypothetical protein